MFFLYTSQQKKLKPKKKNGVEAKQVITSTGMSAADTMRLDSETQQLMFQNNKNEFERTEKTEELNPAMQLQQAKNLDDIEVSDDDFFVEVELNFISSREILD